MSSSRSQRPLHLVPLLAVGCLFFIFGFITWANSQLIPYLKIACELSPSESYLVATAFFAAYFVMALPASAILRRTGYQKGISLGLGIMAAGAFLFIPAAQSRSYPLFLTGLFIIGTGLALLQTASNPYVAELGPHDSAAQRIAIMGICNKIAGILAVVILGSIMLSNADTLIESLKTMGSVEKETTLNALAAKVIRPYTILGASLVALAVLFSFLKLPQIREDEPAGELMAERPGSVLQYPHLLLGALSIFFYVGAEVISYDTFAPFGQSLGFPLATAKGFATFTGYGLLAGYLVGIAAVPKLLNQQRALVFSCLLSLTLVLIACNTRGWTAVWAFAGLGFSNAMMWPAIFPMALKDLGRLTKAGAALLIMGIVGGAVLPPLYGKLGEALHNPQQAYYLLVVCYVFILYFAVRGHKIRRVPATVSGVKTV